MESRTQRCITIDSLPLLFEGGISNYVRPFVGNLLEQTGSALQVKLLFRLGISKARLKQYRESRKAYHSANTSHRLLYLPDRLTSRLWERGILLPASSGHRKDVFIATTELVPKTKKAKVGWIVYDLTQLRIPQFFEATRDAFRSSVARNLKKADFVIAISQCTKRDVQELMQYPEERICVIYPGVTPFNESLPLAKNVPSPERPYLLYLGGLALNKNVDGMLRIFSLCVHKHQLDMDLVLTGKDFCGKDFWQRMIHDLKIEGRVHLTGWISDDDREDLLARASMLWQFSWYEGFGLPVLEAASRGIPVLYSNRGSLPEILQNPEQEIDPAEEEEAAARASAAVKSDDTLEKWRIHGLSRASAFSWEKSCKKLLEWLESRYW